MSVDCGERCAALQQRGDGMQRRGVRLAARGKLAGYEPVTGVARGSQTIHPGITCVPMQALSSITSNELKIAAYCLGVKAAQGVHLPNQTLANTLKGASLAPAALFHSTL